MKSITTTTNIKETALEYAKIGLPILPLCPPDHASMPLTHREACKAPGKAPLLPEWQHRGPATTVDVEEWFKKWPKCNIGLLLGDTGTNNLVGIDIDGEAGEQVLENYSKGILPPTWEFVTGHGRRLIYALPDGAESRKKAVKTKDGELAFLAQGQQTVMPPSIHNNGTVYEWSSSPEETELADAPQWLLNVILIQGAATEQTPEATVTVADWNKKLGKGERNNHLTKLAGSLIARRNIPKEQVKAFLQSWNKDNCSPPLPPEEIDVMVENLHASEQLKASKMSTQKDKDILRPTHFAEYFVSQQNKANIAWRYCVERGLFYTCDKLIGPWEVVDPLYLQKAVRKYLVEQCLEWDNQRSVLEVMQSLRELLADPLNDELFDIGIHPDLKNVHIINGVLEWNTLELRKWTPDTYNTVQLPAIWDPTIKDNEVYAYWVNLLEQWMPSADTRNFLQEYIGYCLIPDCSHRTAVFLFGPGSNGKSLFLDIITRLFQNYISFVPLQWLSSRFETSKLMDKMINVCGDVDSKYMDETSTIKAMISGDPIRAEFKHGKSFHFHPVCRLLFSANQLPRTGDKSEGWYSRWKFVEFPKRFKTSTDFKRKTLSRMATPEALSALLYWAVEGLRRLYKVESFSDSEQMVQAEQQYRMDNDTVQAFVSTVLMKIGHTGADTMLVTPSIYSVYKTWCEDSGVRVVSQHEFIRRMGSLDIEKGVRAVRGASIACFLGVCINQAGQEAGYLEEYLFNESIRASGLKHQSHSRIYTDDYKEKDSEEP